jgi:F0F1-type ATP synthase epsilon subunit
MADTSFDEVLSVKIFSPREVYYDGVAKSLSAANDTGHFDILPLHHSFITLLNTGVVTVGMTNGQQKVLEIEKGLLRVKNNEAVVFLDV